MSIRELGPADVEAAAAFACQHYVHPVGLDVQRTVRATLTQPLGRVLAAETPEGIQAMLHFFRKACHPPFSNRYFFDMLVAGREGKSALADVLAVALDEALREAGAPETVFTAIHVADDLSVAKALEGATFSGSGCLEAGRIVLSGARELPLLEGISIRTAKPEDAARISELSLAYVNPLDWLPESWAHAMTYIDTVLIAEAEGRIVGVGGGKILSDGECIGLMNIAEPEYPFLGFHLFNRVCVKLRSKGAEYLLGLVESQKHRLFYQRIGWEHLRDVHQWEKCAKRIA